jgi:hypothetical protein
VARWLNAASGEMGVDQVTVFAPAQFLGLLRKEQLGNAYELRQAELVRLNPQELASHPDVIACATRQGTSERRI